jgi:hypothetical protein
MDVLSTSKCAVHECKMTSPSATSVDSTSALLCMDICIASNNVSRILRANANIRNVINRQAMFVAGTSVINVIARVTSAASREPRARSDLQLSQPLSRAFVSPAGAPFPPSFPP